MIVSLDNSPITTADSELMGMGPPFPSQATVKGRTEMESRLQSEECLLSLFAPFPGRDALASRYKYKHDYAILRIEHLDSVKIQLLCCCLNVESISPNFPNPRKHVMGSMRREAFKGGV